MIAKNPTKLGISEELGFGIEKKKNMCVSSWKIEKTKHHQAELLGQIDSTYCEFWVTLILLYQPEFLANVMPLGKMVSL